MARFAIRSTVMMLVLWAPLSALPALATVPGENGRIAFVAGDEGDVTIYSVNADGSGRMRLSDPRNELGADVTDTDPTWSPDGRLIAFTRTVDRSDSSDTTLVRSIWVMSADGSNQSELALGSDPTWSPDGRSIAFVLDTNDGDSRMPSVIAMVDLSGRITILTDAEPLAGGKPTNDSSPAWDPGGEEVVFLRRGTPASPMSSFVWLLAVDITSGSVRSIMPDGEGFGHWANNTDISPDSSRLVASRMYSIAARPVAYMYDLASGLGSPIDGPVGRDAPLTASFAPSGDLLAVKLLDGSMWTMGLDGADPIEIGRGGQPAWQPLNPYPFGLVDPGSGIWHLRYPDGRVDSFYFGNPGDAPFMGDWDCDGIDTPGLYRQSDGYVYLRNSNTQGIADTRFFFGDPGDIPLAGDFNGDGCDTVSVYRPSNATFYIINKLGSDDAGLGAAETAFIFGNPKDVPFVGDFDGDGVDTPGLYRKSSGLVYYRNWNSEGDADGSFFFGNAGDRIVVYDWTGDGVDSPAAFRPSDTTVFIRFTNTQGSADAQFMFGEPPWLPVVGTFG